MPSSLKAEGVTDRPPVKTVYPRLVYAFSTCIVFVTSGSLASADIKEQLRSYAFESANGSRKQGFKPSLFVVFNRFNGGDAQNFDWSIKASSEAFLKDGTELGNFYSNIQVVNIPRSNSAKAAIALKQLDTFYHALRAENKEAFRRRQQFRLDFTPGQLTPVLHRALDYFSANREAFFDWALEAPPIFSSKQSDKILADLWTQYLKHHSRPTSPAIPYDAVRQDFEKHVTFCLRLRLSRRPPHGTPFRDTPLQWVEQLGQLFLEYTPCSASHHGSKCEKVRLRHGDYHEDSRANRWPGEYERDMSATLQTFRESFEATLRMESRVVSLKDLCKCAR